MSPGIEQVRAALLARPGQRLQDDVTGRAAVGMVLREAEPGLELLMIRRAEHPRDPWSGQMAFPGGRAEPTDADLVATARREVREEVGLDLEGEGEFLGALDELRAMARLRPMDLTIQPFVFHLRGPGPARVVAEVQSVHWLELRRLLSAEVRGSHRYLLGGRRVLFPCLRVDGLTIWGLTYRMLMSLDERLLALAQR